MNEKHIYEAPLITTAFFASLHAVVSCASAAFIAFSTVSALAAEGAATAESIIQSVGDGELEAAEALIRLRAQGQEAAEWLVENRPQEPAARLLRNRALIHMGHPEIALEDLLSWVESESPMNDRFTAASLAGIAAPNVPAADQKILSTLRRTTPDLLKIPLARALWSCATTEAAQIEAGAALKRALDSKDAAVRHEGALGLGELGQFYPTVREVLQKLQGEPGEQGRLARSLLQNADLTQRLLHPGAWGGSLGAALLDELRYLLKRYHIDPPAPDAAYVNAAAHGIVEIVRPADRFTEYYAAGQWEAFQQEMAGTFAGIGIRIAMLKDRQDSPTALPTIVSVMLDDPAPAYRAGLRSYDQIEAIDGVPTDGKSLDEVSAALRGEAGTKVALTIRRYGQNQPQIIEVERAQITLRSTHSELLPGEIGYLALSVFSDRSPDEFEAALRDLEAHGIRGLIIDLRSNPGGLIEAVVHVADKFLKDNRLITYSQGRNPEVAPRIEYRTSDPATHPDYPLVCLINGESASGSEMLSGALQDHKRAILVGTRTYGKGSVQQTFPLRSVNGRAAVKITIAEYFLPSGRSIHRKGVEPDIEVADTRQNNHEAFEALRLRGALDAYWAAHWPGQAERLRAVAEYDAAQTACYPDFDAWFERFADGLTADKARAALRQWIRLRVQEELGAPLFTDVQEDAQLQRAIVELVRQIPDSPAEQVEMYRSFLSKQPVPAEEK